MNDASILSPRENPLLKGHEAAEAILLDAAKSGRMAHAWILAGPPGIGKATLAYRFARNLLAGGDAQGEGLFGNALISLAIDEEWQERGGGACGDEMNRTKNILL